MTADALPTVLGIVASALGIAGLGAVVFVRWRSSSDETAALLWKEEAFAWKAKAERLEAGFLDLRTRVEQLEAENRSLRTLYDPSASIAAMRAEVLDALRNLTNLMEERGH